MAKLLKFPCPHCNVRLNAKAEKAGRSYGCPNCSALVEVPTPRALVPVKPRIIVPEVIEVDEPPRVPARRRKRRKDDLIPEVPYYIDPEVIGDDEPVLVPARRRKNRDDEMVPVKVKIPGVPGAEFEGAVDEKTSNAVTTTVVGGFLVALGAIIFAMFGGKGRSA